MMAEAGPPAPPCPTPPQLRPEIPQGCSEETAEQAVETWAVALRRLKGTQASLGQPSPGATRVSGMLSRHTDLIRGGDCSCIFSKRGGTSPVLQGSSLQVPEGVSNRAAVCAICTGFCKLIYHPLFHLPF